MKKLFFIFALFLPICAIATDMCARNNTMVLVLDPILNGTGDYSNSHEWMWWNYFPYGYISGNSTCLSLHEGLGQTTIGAYYGKGEYANTLINADSGLSGYDSDGNERKYCWYKMTHPLSSGWVFNQNYSSATACKNNCAKNWASDLNKNPIFRAGLFNSVGL